MMNQNRARMALLASFVLLPSCGQPGGTGIQGSGIPLDSATVTQRSAVLASQSQRSNPSYSRKGGVIYITASQSGSANEVLLYNFKGNQIGSIGDGIAEPGDVAVDKSGNVFVANEGNSTVTEYPPGQTTPSLTISSGLNSPVSVAVDAAGAVYVGNWGNGSVTVYPAGVTSPSRTISGFGLPYGLSVRNRKLYVADGLRSVVYVVGPNSSKLTNLNLQGVSYPRGLAFDRLGNLYLGNFTGSSGNVSVYAPGSTSPSYSITSGIASSGPHFLAVSRASNLYVATGSAVEVYGSGQTSPLQTIVVPVGSGSIFGVAVSPATP